ncbi:MAG TPA: sulfotransferase, partial [Spirochaetota bacterium]|nr:sulfotransferase [Spirochaetota bacterium]
MPDRKIPNQFLKKIHIGWTILTSCNSTAYAVILIKIFHYLLLPLDYFFYFIECFFIKKIDLSRRTGPIFITGLHRSGSTYISQVLADYLPCTALGNFEIFFPRSRYIAQKIKKFFYQRSSVAKHHNFYGYTPGICSIGEAHEFWDQWFGNEHWHIPDHLQRKTVTAIARRFALMSVISGRPVLAKMLRGSVYLNVINQIFPTAFFIVVKRQPEYVVQSVLKANRDFFGASDKPWGLMLKKDIAKKADMSETEYMCARHAELEREFKQQLAKLPSGRYITVRYEDF